jgi:hypothetical protein
MGCSNSSTEASIVKRSSMNLTTCQVMPVIIHRATPQKPVSELEIELPVIHHDASVSSQKMSRLAVSNDKILLGKLSMVNSNLMGSNVAPEQTPSHRSRLSGRKPQLSLVKVDHEMPMGNFQFPKLNKSSSVRPGSVDGDSMANLINMSSNVPNVITGDSATWKKPHRDTECQMPKVSIDE